MTQVLYEIDRVRATEERAAIFALRITVFVEEQAVPVDEELDAYDADAVHFLVRHLPLEGNGAIVGTARLIDKGGGIGKVGRVAIVREHRGRGAGALLMRRIEEAALQSGFTRLDLDAQLYALPFYEKLDYVAEGDIFLDAGIEHRHMSKQIA